MITANWIALISGIAAIASAFIAYRSVLSAKRSADRAELALKAKIFIDLRERWHSIRKDLKRIELDSKMVPHPEDERWDIHDLYWHHTFTEWYVATQLYPEFSSLWKDFFSHAVQKTLRTHEPLLYVAWYLVKNKKTTFGSYNDAFCEELERLNDSEKKGSEKRGQI